MKLADTLKGFRLGCSGLKPRTPLVSTWGRMSIKIVQLKGSGGRWKLHRCAHLPLQCRPMWPLPSAVPRPWPPQRLHPETKRLCGQGGRGFRLRQLCDRSLRQISQNVQDDLSKMIVIEAEPYIPFSIPEVNLDFQILGDVVEEAQKKWKPFCGREKRNCQRSRRNSSAGGA